MVSKINETKSILDDIETYATNPETIATDAFNYVSEALTDFYDNLSLMTQPDHPDFDLALQDLAVGFTKSMIYKMIDSLLINSHEPIFIYKNTGNMVHEIIL